MTTGYKIRDQHGIYFLTFQVIDWIDIFTRQVYRDIVLDSYKYAIKHKGLQLHAYVIMSNHIHCILSSKTGKLSDTVRDIKRHTSKHMLNAIQTTHESRRDWIMELFSRNASKHKRNLKYQIWTHENHPVHLDSQKFKKQKLNYIHQNPVRAGIVDKAESYLYSSARNYTGLDALIDIQLLDI